MSIVIPCRNEREHIGTCLASTLNQLAPEGGFEVVVADGMSDDGTREILKLVEDGGLKTAVRVKVIDNPGLIVSCGLNAAVRASCGQIIVRMDAHTEYALDYIQRCVEVLEQTGADNVGGPARTRAEGYVGQAIAAAYHSPFSVGGARFHDIEHEGWVDTVTYGCWRRDAFNQFGYFDENLVRNQDDEHNLRIIRGGGRIYQSPKIQSWYRPRSSLGALFVQYMQYGYWKVRVIRKHKLPASWRHLVPGAFLLTLAVLFLLSAVCFLFLWLTDYQPLTADLCRLSSGLLALMLAAYTVALIVASLITATRSGLRLFPILPLVFPCYHLGYGYGFLRGMWDFVIRRKGDRKSFVALTR